MKRIFLLLVLFLAACSNQPDNQSGGGSTPSATRLTIVNSSSYFLELVCWYDNSGTAYYFCPDSIWDSGISMNVGGLGAGHSYSREVLAGTSCIYFYFVNVNTRYRTSASVSVSAGTSQTFTIYNSTGVIGLSVLPKVEYATAAKAGLNIPE